MAAVGSLAVCVQGPPRACPHPEDLVASGHPGLGAPRAERLFSLLHREKLGSFLPAHLCKRGHGLFAALRGRGAKAGTGEQGLLDAYRKVKEVVGSDSEREAPLGTHYHAYLLKCHELPFYG